VRYDIRERSDLSLLRRPSASCGVRCSAVLLPLRPLLTPVEMKKKKARKTGNSTDPLERVRQKVLVIKDPLKRPFHRKKRTPLGNVRRENCDLLSRREVFFLGRRKAKKKSVTPKIRKFRLSWGSKRYAIQHETKNHATLLTGTGDFVKIPKIGAIHKKKR
jgi:hypothetical protein